MARGRRGNLTVKPYQSPARGATEHPPFFYSYVREACV